ncbi:MAG: glycosyltransferase family 39 protein, partial [Thiohalomonadales bacterium]
FVYLLTRKLSGQKEAFYAGILFAVYPSFIQYSLGTRSETTYIFLLIASVYLLLLLAERMENSQPTTRIAIALGVVLALPALTRSVGVVMIPVAIVWLAWHAYCVKYTFKPVAIVVGIVILTLLPWITVVSMTEGRFVPLSISGDKALGLSDHCYVGPACVKQEGHPEHPLEIEPPDHTNYTANRDWSNYLKSPKLTVNPPYSWSRVDWIDWSIPPEMIWKDPLKFATTGLQHWWVMWGTDTQAARQLLLVGYPPANPIVVSAVLLSTLIMELTLITFAILGILYAGTGFRRNGLVIAIVLAFMAVHFLLAIGSKYSVPLEALLLPIAAQGMTRLGAIRPGSSGWPRLIVAGSTIVLAWLVVLTSSQTMFGNTVKSPSSYYAGLARNLEGYIDGYLPTTDRFLFRVSSKHFPSEISISTASEDYVFEPGGSRTMTWKPGEKSIISVVTADRLAEDPVRLVVQSKDRSGAIHSHNIFPGKTTWQKWQPINSTGIEYLWVGGANFPIDGLRIMALNGDKPVLGPVDLDSD